MLRHARRVLRPMLLAAALVSPARALAQADPAAMASARAELIQQAQAARATSDHPRALQLAERAGQLQMSVSLRRFIAEEQAELGQYGPAAASADACLRECARDTAAVRAEHEAPCQAIATRMQPRVGRVVVRVNRPEAGMRVAVADADVPPAQWGTAYPVTPGLVAVTSTAPDRLPFRREVDVAAGAQVVVTVVLAEGMPSGSLGDIPGVTDGAAAPTPTPAPARRDPRATGRVGAGPFVLLGLGALTLTGAGIFLVLRGSAINDRDAMCDSTGCPDTARDAHDRAVTWNTLANVSFGVGGALAAAGLIWFIVSPRSSDPPPRTALQVVPLRDGAMVGVQGVL